MRHFIVLTCVHVCSTAARACLAVLAALLLLGGCDTPSASPSVTTTLAPTATPAMTARSSPDITERADSPFKRRDIPPQGITRQLAFGGSGGGESPCYPPDQPRNLLKPGDTDKQLGFIEVAQTMLFEVCFDGLSAEQLVEVQVVLPDGSVRSSKIEIADWQSGTDTSTNHRYHGALEWVSLPGEPTGEYAVTFVQGRSRASATFEVRAASSPRLQVVTPDSGPPGSTFRVALAGFQPHEHVALYLYRSDRGTDCPTACFAYATSLGTVEMDQHGQLIYMLSTQPDDPKDSYQIVPGIHFNTIYRVTVYRGGLFSLT